MRLPVWARVALVLLAVIWLARDTAVQLAVDWWWFSALGQEQVFLTSLSTQAALFILGALVTAAFIGINLWMAGRRAPFDFARLAKAMGDLRLPADRLRSLFRLAALAGAALPALVVGRVGASLWLDALAWRAAAPTGDLDPVFGADLSFHFFGLPLLNALQATLVAVVVITWLPLALMYLGRDALGRNAVPQLGAAGRAHLLALGAGFFALVAAGYWLDRYDLLVGTRGAVWGAGYTDLEVRLPALMSMAIVSLAVSLALAAATFTKGWRLPAYGIGGWVALRFVLLGLLPDLTQTYAVVPNELEYERPYLERNIAGTRAAFGLERIEVQPFDPTDALTAADLEANPLTVGNIRVWDDRPLLTTYNQLQSIRTYYEFQDVDVDRYRVDGELRQVMLSARELQFNRITEGGDTWVNKHLKFTHGYGLTMSPVNVVTSQGLPELWVQDLPPTTTIDLPIDQPAIYYGEATNSYVFTGAGVEEFDFPVGDQNAATHYSGKGGVGIGSMPRKLLFALYFGAVDLLFADSLDASSKVLFRRQIQPRVQAIAPFLVLDRDPYLVVSEGRLKWMIDAYTSSGRYPYSETHKVGRQSLNYMRNSVKIVVDAYDGDVRFFVADEDDLIVQTYAQIFPELFEPLSDMPADLAEHSRYPVDFFDIQAALYRAYHMTDPAVFYNKEDVWAVPQEKYNGQETPMESYYLITRLPGEPHAEFVLLLPFAPAGKENMISWLAARSDGEDYGNLVLYQFPKHKLTYGPRQIEALIDQDADISQQITLWGDQGSEVVRGNLLVIPIEDSLIYVEPLYLQAESSQLPEMKRVIVSYENRIAMEPTLAGALAAVFGDAPRRPTAAQKLGIGSPPKAAPPTGEWSVRAVRAEALLQSATAAQRAGDWARYGQELAALEAELAGLRDLAQPPAPSVPEGAAPADNATPESP